MPLECPSCGLPLRVTSTRGTRTTIKRYRTCPNGHHYASRETLIGGCDRSVVDTEKTVTSFLESVRMSTANLLENLPLHHGGKTHEQERI